MYNPIVLIILDGFGRGPENAANAIFKAEKPNFDSVEKNFPMTNLQASGIAVGLPWGEEGNSEVGHLNLGAGRIVYQYLPRITFAIRDGSFFENSKLLEASEHVVKNNSSLHIIGLVGQGNVHSHIDHLYSILDFAKKHNLSKVFIHAFTNGRDSPPKDALNFYEKIQNRLNRDYPFAKIASLIGRHYALDRDNNWDRTEKAYNLMMENNGQIFDNVKSAIESDYDKGITDEFIEPKVIGTVGAMPEPIKDGDAVIFIDFREDSARQLSQTLFNNDFDKFTRKKINDLYFVTMTRYEPGLPHVLFEPLKIGNTVSKIISDAGKSQIHIAETEKYAHVTYFFNGGIENPFPGEERTLIPSARDFNFANNPAMSAAEITKKTLEAITSQKYNFILVNYANADMVGHTGNFDATVKAVEILDKELGSLTEAMLKTDGVLIITSDHGNADEKINLLTGSSHPEHSANPVPFYLIGNDFKKDRSQENIEIKKVEVDGILADVAPTILELMELKKPLEMTGNSLLGALKIN